MVKARGDPFLHMQTASLILVQRPRQFVNTHQLEAFVLMITRSCWQYPQATYSRFALVIRDATPTSD
jgi:hypothetical protein